MHELVPLIDPNGEVLAGSLEQASDQTLARLAAAWEGPRRQAADMLALVKGELRARMQAADVRKVTLDGHEVRLEYSSAWDVDELDGVVTAMVERGVLSAAECAGLIKTETHVSAAVATQLLQRLGPADRLELENCRSWRVRTVKVTPPVDAEAIEEPVPVIEEGR